MQPSDSRDLLLVAVEHEIASLEALSGDVERALMRRDWKRMETAIADTRRITHALRNAMDAAQEVVDDAFSETINRRLRYVHAIRENQMTRLQQYQDAIGERLRLIARWKSALRSMGKPQQPRPQLGSLDQLT